MYLEKPRFSSQETLVTFSSITIIVQTPKYSPTGVLYTKYGIRSQNRVVCLDILASSDAADLRTALMQLYRSYCSDAAVVLMYNSSV